MYDILFIFIFHFSNYFTFTIFYYYNFIKSTPCSLYLFFQSISHRHFSHIWIPITLYIYNNFIFLILSILLFFYFFNSFNFSNSIYFFYLFFSVSAGRHPVRDICEKIVYYYTQNFYNKIRKINEILN